MRFMSKCGQHMKKNKEISKGHKDSATILWGRSNQSAIGGQMIDVAAVLKIPRSTPGNMELWVFIARNALLINTLIFFLSLFCFLLLLYLLFLLLLSYKKYMLVVLR